VALLIPITSAAYVVMPGKRVLGLLAAALLLAASCSSASTGVLNSPSPVAGALTGGLIGYASVQGVGVLDPATGKSTLVAPMPAGGAFRVAGPVWGPAPGLAYPVLYFTVHDDRPAERRTTSGVVPYDWLFRVDPFTGVISALAASSNFQSEGPIGLGANGHYLALTLGCCADYEVDVLDLTQPPGPLRVVSKPPAQTAMFTEGVAPGASGLIAVREVGTGAWYWLNADANVLNPFPLALGTDDGPIAISPDGTLAAVSRPDHGPVIEPINVALPIASPTPSATGATPTSTASAAPKAAASPSATPRPLAAPRPVNSGLPHADGLAWSPDAKMLAVAVNGELEIYIADAADGTAPTAKYPAGGGGVIAVDWSGPIPDQSLALVKPSAGPQALVDALLDATKLPAAADSPAARPLTKVYLWQFDSTKASPIASIEDATPAVLQQYPPLAAGVVFHHWAPTANWELLGGCYRYRVVITGSVPPTASTFGLGGNTLCNAPSPTPLATPTGTKTP
jgi:hypothetical protein